MPRRISAFNVADGTLIEPGPESSSTLTPGPPLATPTTATTITPPTPATFKKGPTKLTRKDTATSAILRDSADDGSAKITALNAASRSSTSPAPSPAVASPTSNPGVDPLSQHIFQRTNTEISIAKGPRIRNPAAAKASERPDSPAIGTDPVARQSSDLAGRPSLASSDAIKDRKKGGSFLSRLGIRKAPKNDAESIADSESEFNGEPRMNGADAHVFSNNVEAAGYIPHHKTPPRYIRVRAHNKKSQDREFNRMFLAQELVGTHPKLTEKGEQADDKVPFVTVSVAGAGGRRRERTGGAIWATEFSRDGKYLAAAGKDGVVRIWAVISTQEERRRQEEEEAAQCPVGERLSAPVFLERPVREFSGHTNEILDLSWSKNNFLLSTGMDKTVRLWHISRDECLCTFKHKDLVTKVAFHPTDDRFFLAGSLDMNLRLWSIPDKSIAYSVHLPDLITAVAFSPDGKTAIAGLLNGLCMIYETEGLKFQSQIHAKSSRGKNSKGSKITGIRTATMPLTAGGSNGTQPGEVKIMISTNDSRIRVYNLKDGSLDIKFKGHENACTQISASFSEDAQYIITGSENSKTFIWKMGSAMKSVGDLNKDKHPCESFDAHGEIVTTALFAPTSTKQLLSASGDPIYDLCNPPPVVLMSADEHAAASASASQAAPSEAGTEDQNLEKPPPTPSFAPKKTEPSAAYVARTAHRGGNIIVTTDDQGVIKVFRQDCAFGKRRHDSWETGSSLSRKPGGGGGMLGRSASIRTRTSTGSAAHSRRGSLNMGPWQPPGTPKLPSDMILSWRQNVERGGPGRPVSIASSLPTPTRSERSISPGKNTRSPATGSRGNLAADARKQQYVLASPRHLPVGGEVPDSPTSSIGSRLRPKTASAAEPKKHTPTPLQLTSGEDTPTKAEHIPVAPVSRKSTSRTLTISDTKDAKETSDSNLPMSPPVPSFSFKSTEGAGNETPRLDPTGTSSGFWNLNRWKGLAGLKTSNTSASSSEPTSNKKHTRTASDAVLDMPTPGFHFEGARRKSMADTPAARPKTVHRNVSGLSTVASREDLQAGGSSGASALGVKPSVASGENGSGFLRADSVVSRLSSDISGLSESEVDGQAAAPCGKCGTKKTKVKKAQGRQKVVCGRCGTAVSGA